MCCMGEQLTLNQWAQGSSPWRCTIKKAQDRKILRLFFLRERGCTFSAHCLHISLISGDIRASSAQPAFSCTKRKFSGEQQPDKLPAFVWVHLPDGFKDHRTCDVCCLRLFAFLRSAGRGTGYVLFVEVGFDLLCQLNPGLVLGMGVGVHQDACGGVPGVSLDRLEVAAGLEQLIGCAGMTQSMKDNLLKFRMFTPPLTVPLGQYIRGDGQTVRQTEQLPTVSVLFWGGLLVLLQLLKPGQKFFL